MAITFSQKQLPESAAYHFIGSYRVPLKFSSYVAVMSLDARRTLTSRKVILLKPEY